MVGGECKFQENSLVSKVKTKKRVVIVAVALCK